MDYSPYASGRPQWLQTQLHEHPHNQEERSPQRTEGAGEVMLGASEDVPASNSNVPATVHPQTFYMPPYAYSPYNNYPISPYGQQTQPPQWSVPLSTYSSLNGATSGQTPTQLQHSPVQQQHSPVVQHHSPPPPPQPSQHYQPQQSQPQPQITIDPTLMLNNYSHQPTHSPNGYAPTAYYTFPSHAQPLSLNPSLLHASPQSPKQPNQSNQQNGPVAGPSHPPKSALISVLSGLLAAKGLPNSPSQIVQTITAMGSPEVDLNLRLKVLSKIRDSAGNDFYQAWASNVEAMDIIRDWLKATVISKNGDWDETIMPLLHVIDRLPLTTQSLKTSRLGKVVLKLKEASSSAAVKDMASNLEARWRTLLNSTEGKTPADGGAKKSEGRTIEEPRPKKRKPEEHPTKVVPPSKKMAVSKATNSTPKAVPVVKKEAKPVTAVKDAKSDSSFFSAPKPKPKLPSFKKAAVPVKKPSADQNIAQPSAVDPFKDALAAMTKSRSSPTPMETVVTPPTSVPPGISVKTGKRKKKVAFQTDDKLVKIHIIEPAVYEDDATNGVYPMHNVRDLDRDEGAAMHQHLFEEQIDWAVPLPIDIPPEFDTPRGSNSQEKVTQEEREKSALNALYMSPSQIPDSPAEPALQIPEDEVDMKVKPMVSGNEVRDLDRGDNAAKSVQGLISQLAGSSAADGMDTASTSIVPPLDLKQLGLDLNLIAQLQKAAQAQPNAVNGFTFQQQQPVPPQPSYMGGEQTWNTQYQDYGQAGYDEDGDQRTKTWNTPSDPSWNGRGGRGGGRGGPRGGFRNNKRKLCNFFANGRCRYGDQCDFSHEL